MKYLGEFTVGASGVKVDTPIQFLVIVTTEAKITGTLKVIHTQNGSDKVHLSEKSIDAMQEYFAQVYGQNIISTSGKNIAMLELAVGGAVKFDADNYLTVDLVGVVAATKKFKLYAYDSPLVTGRLVNYTTARVLASTYENTHNVADAEFIIFPATSGMNEIWLHYSNGVKIKHTKDTLELMMLINNELLSGLDGVVKAGFINWYVIPCVQDSVRLSELEIYSDGTELSYIKVDRIY